MTREEMIEAIYLKISDKTLKLGCKVKYDFNDEGFEEYVYLGEFENIDGKMKHHFLNIQQNRKVILDINEIGTYIEVIGDPVMISDVLDYFSINNWNSLNYQTELDGQYLITQPSNYARIIINWKHKRLPIEEQSDETVKFVFNLIPKK